MVKCGVLMIMLGCGVNVGLASELSQWIAAYERPEVGDVVEVNGFAHVLGHVRVTVQSGQGAVLTVMGEPAGLFIWGDNGHCVMRSSDDVELPVLRYNTKKGTKLDLMTTEDGEEIHGNFETLLIWAPMGMLPPLEGTPVADGSALQSHLDEHLQAVKENREGPAIFPLIQQRLDGQGAVVVRMEMEGGKEPMAYVFDTMTARAETFMCYRKTPRSGIPSEIRDLRSPVILSDQPIGRKRGHFVNPPFLLTDLTYTLIASDDKDAWLSITETIMPVDNPKRTLCFEMDSYDLGTNRDLRHFNVKTVADEKGNQLAYHHERGKLLVLLAEPIAANATAKIQFEIDGDFLVRPNNDNFWQLGTTAWFPQPDLNGQYYTIHATIKVAKPFIAFAPGTTVRREEEGEYNVVETRVDKPVQFAVVHAGKYFTHETRQGDVTIRVASYGIKKSHPLEQLGRLAGHIIEFYEPWLGPFPFKEFNVLEINALGYGQAPPGTMFITREVFDPRGDTISKIYSKGANHRFAHEIAHQYWAHVVKMGSAEDQWHTEALAEYSSAMFIRRLKGETGYKAMVSEWRSNAKRASDVSCVPLCNRISADDRMQSYMHRNHLLYDKSAYLMYALHQKLGDDLFASYLRSLQGVYAWKYVTQSDFLALLNHMTKEDHSGFFDRYFWHTHMPE